VTRCDVFQKKERKKEQRKENGMKFWPDGWTCVCSLIFGVLMTVGTAIELVQRQGVTLITPVLFVVAGAVVWRGWPLLTNSEAESPTVTKKLLQLYTFGAVGIGAMATALFLQAVAR
jgi:hypothetical protein